MSKQEKEYIGSQQHWEDEVNAYYDKLDDMNKQEDNRVQEQPIEEDWIPVDIALPRNNSIV